MADATEPSGGNKKREGVKVVLEQIVIALALAFVFRAFVLEAFVIPTGSMATTLLGAHMRFDCPDCGWDYTVNYSTIGGTTAIPTNAVVGGRPRVYTVRCPNCGYRLPPLDPADPDNDATAPPVYHGDRILVLKHLYLLKDPDRWDSVVFKNPNSAASRYANTPPGSTEAYQENYIKRLIGLPGETLVLLSGDVYVADDAGNTPTAELTPEDFRIARKDAVAQSALWRVVYDDDYRPQQLDRTDQTDAAGRVHSDAAWRMPWVQSEGGGWQAVPKSAGSGFAFDNAQGGGTLAFDPEANPRAFAFTDYLAYDITNREQIYRGGFTADTFGEGHEFEGQVGGGRPGLRYWLNPADDLKLRLFYERTAGDGPLELKLSRRGDRFVARLLPDKAELFRRTEAGEDLFLGKVERDGLTPVGGGRTVEFENVDYRVRLRVDGDLILETTDAQYAPDVAALVEMEQDDAVPPTPAAEIRCANQSARLRHVSLWRDIVYTARGQYGGFYPHASPEGFPRDVIRLRDDEYFVLGDNPFLSGDARTWEEPVVLDYEALSVAGGRVPGRFLMGKAFFVYWPGGYRAAGSLPAVVPNFGGMRFIR